MKITVKLRFNSSRQRIESYGNGKYLIYLSSDKTDPGASEEVLALLSRHLGVPTGRIEYVGKQDGDIIFQLI